MIFPTAGGVVMLTTAADSPNDIFWDALRIENSASPRVRATTAPGAYVTNSLEFDATGRLVYVDATLGLPAGTTYSNGFPLDPNGALCVSTNAPVSWANGVPYADNGAISVGITP